MDAAVETGERTLFVRKSTGLVRSWSVFDTFVYASFVMSVVAVGFGYPFTAMAFLPSGTMYGALILSCLFIFFEVLVYASLVSAMPRAGGDYVWQSRVLGGGVGFVLAATGWWFILWHWVPIYAQILAVEVLQPILTVLGFTGTDPFHADWWPYSATNGWGIFTTSMITAGIAAVAVAVGMRVYSRFQRWCFYGGVVALAILVVLFFAHSRADFVNAFNSNTGANAYQKTLDASSTAGLGFTGLTSLSITAMLVMTPFLAFYNLWPNWAATLYGEVRGAKDFRKNVYAMGGALVFTTVTAIITFAAIDHAMGYNFFAALSASYWGVAKGPVAMFPYPGTLATFFIDNGALKILLLALLSLWWWGWVGSVFLSSTRMIFAAAFDRLLPSWAASVTSQTRVPVGALALMLLPAIPISAEYAFNTRFYTYTLDATLVIAITYAGTTLSAIVMPWRMPEVYNASPIARLKVAGIPLITLSGVVFIAFLGYLIVKWLSDTTYGVNNPDSLKYMGVLYVVAIAIYVAARIIRRRQGIDMRMINSSIPVE
jgi:amino acid transporter